MFAVKVEVDMRYPIEKQAKAKKHLLYGTAEKFITI